MDIIAEVKKLKLPAGQYAVVGSGILDVKGIRKSNDIDLLITQEIYDQLKAKGWKEERYPNTPREWVLFDGPFDVSTSWGVGDYIPDVSKIMNTAEVIDGVPFARIEEVLKWKQAARRPKDLKDINLIEAYLAKL